MSAPGFSAIIFDLDGTLWNTSPGCAIAWNSAVKKNKISFREIVAEDIERVTGLPHEECVRKVFAELPEADIQTLIKETTDDDGLEIILHGGLLYRGVRESISELAAHYELFITSNCQSGYIESFLEWSGFTDSFKDFECWGNTRLTKSDNVASLIKRNNLKNDLGQVLMVGDTPGDARAGYDNGLSFAYMSYGFAAVQDPTFEFQSFGELANWLLQKN